MKIITPTFWVDKFRSKGTRSKGIIVGSFALVASQFFNILAGFFITGLLTRYLLPDEFGLWALIMSLTGIFGGMDFGFANALRNKISQLYVNKDSNDKLIHNYFFSIFYSFLVWAIFVTFAIVILKPFISWSALFNSTNTTIIREGSILFVIGASMFSFGLAFNVSTVGFYSYQESHWNAILGIISKLFLLFATFLLINKRSSFVFLNITFLFITFFFGLVTFIVFVKKRKWSIRIIDYRIISCILTELFGKSLQFILLQIAAILYAGIDLFLISKIFGLSPVGDFSLIKKLFQVCIGFQFSFLMPIWSAYTEAVQSNDFKWVKYIVNKSAFYSIIIFTLLTIFLVLLGPYIIHLWTGKTINNRSLFLLLGLYYVITAWNNTFSVFLNSNNLLIKQILCFVFGSIILFILSFVLGSRYGLIGFCLALIIASLPLAISNPIESYKFIKSRESKI